MCRIIKNKICHAYISKYNQKCKSQEILFRTTDDGKRWHYLAVRSLSELLRGIPSTNIEDFYCLNCFHSYLTLTKLKKHEFVRVCNNHDYCHVDMPREGKNILKYSPGDKSLKAPFIISEDLDCLLKREQSCQNSPKNSYTERKAKHKPSGYLLSLICLFDETKNKHKFYRRKDCIKRFCNDLKKLVTEIINYKEEEITPLKDKEVTLSESEKVCYISKQKFNYDRNNKSEYALYHKVRDHCQYIGKFRGAAHNICNLR